jgi:hypothetical protein
MRPSWAMTLVREGLKHDIIELSKWSVTRCPISSTQGTSCPGFSRGGMASDMLETPGTPIEESSSPPRIIKGMT